MALHNELGKWGEEMAVDLLISKGYGIVEQNWRLGHHEIDIIAMKNNRLVFVEVKTRSNPYADPLEAVDERRINRLARAAHFFIVSRDLPLEYQFDIIAVSGVPGHFTINHHPDAFLAPLHTIR